MQNRKHTMFIRIVCTARAAAEKAVENLYGTRKKCKYVKYQPRYIALYYNVTGNVNVNIIFGYTDSSGKGVEVIDDDLLTTS